MDSFKNLIIHKYINGQIERASFEKSCSKLAPNIIMNLYFLISSLSIKNRTALYALLSHPKRHLLQGF